MGVTPSTLISLCTLTTLLFCSLKTALSPYINRFLQPDTLIPGVDSPQSWNRFSYTLNNPVRFNDPTGHMVVDEDRDGSSCDKKLKKTVSKKPCNDKRDLTDWMARALPDSANYPGIKKIAQINSGAFGVGDLVSRTISAGFQFRNLVKNDAYFDVKWNIQRTVGQGQPIKLGSSWYEFSTAGNIIYGFYGHSAGYNLQVLSAGAGYAQLNDYKIGLTKDLGSWTPPFYFDTKDDHYAIEFGYQLYEHYANNGTLSEDDFTIALDDFSHKKDMALRPAPSDCKSIKQPYRTDEFYNK